MRFRLRTPGFPLRAPLMLLLVMVLGGAIHARRAEDFLVARWTVEHGLPQNTVRDLARTADGYLWLATRSGLVRFDGFRFTVFNRWNSPELPSEEILSLAPADADAIWVGTTGGLVRRGPRGWETAEAVPGIAGAVTALAQDDKLLWIGTSRGLLVRRAAGNPAGVIGWPAAQAVTRMRRDPGRGWLAGSAAGGVFRLQAGDIPRAVRLASLDGPVRDLAARGEEVWVAAASGLYRLAGNAPPAAVPLPPEIRPRSLARDGAGELWLGTESQGLWRMDGSAAVAVAPSALEGRSVLSLLADREGNLWAGMEVAGLFRLRRRAVTALKAGSGPVTAVMEDPAGAIWALSPRRGIWRREDGEGAAFVPVLPVAGALSMSAAADGVLWVGTEGRGLLRLDTRSRDTRWFLKDLNVSIRAVTTGEGTGTWVATDGGLFRGDGKHFAPVNLPAGESSDVAVSVILRSGDGWWVGGAGGVWYAPDENGPWRRLTGTEARPGPRQVTALFRDRDGTLWAGTRGWGLFGRNNGNWSRLDENSGLADNYVLGIAQDRTGYLWCGSQRGVFRIMEKRPRRLLAAQGARVDCMVWNESDGLPGSECSGAAQPSAWETSTGELLFPTLQGVALVHPLLAAERAPEIPVLIEAVLADSRVLDATRPVDLIRPVEMLEFHFTYSCLSAPEKVVFRYRLRGFDDQWTQTMPGRERTALYLNLDPGRYTFQVQARGGSGFWSPATAAYALRIRRPFPWPWLLALLLLPAGYLVLRRVRNGRRVPVRPKYQTSGLTADVAESKLKDLLALMETEKPYLEANLTLGALAKRLGIHQNYLSRIINEYRRQSFNDFVNQYRIAEVRRRLTSPQWGSHSILQIAYETGFYSKSVFNTAFKKFTGQTPSQYRQGSATD